MREFKVHFGHDDKYSSCGKKWVDKMRTDPTKVTCKSCMKTKKYREALTNTAYNKNSVKIKNIEKNLENCTEELKFLVKDWRRIEMLIDDIAKRLKECLKGNIIWSPRKLDNLLSQYKAQKDNLITVRRDRLESLERVLNCHETGQRCGICEDASTCEAVNGHEKTAIFAYLPESEE